MNDSRAAHRLVVVGPGGDVCDALEADDALVRVGWERRYMTSRSKSEEARELYESLGFEVMLRSPKSSEFDDGCSSCAVQACNDDIVVYTRKPSNRVKQSQQGDAS